MKLHFSITAAEELREERGGRYVLYSVCLEGFLLGKVRYSQLRSWDAQLRQLFGSAVPSFPPKFYLAMTKSMADERQSQLEQYLQNVTLNSNITNSDVFTGFFQKLQQAWSLDSFFLCLTTARCHMSHFFPYLLSSCCGPYEDSCVLEQIAVLNIHMHLFIHLLFLESLLPRTVAVSFLQTLRYEDTFKIQTQRAFLDVYLADGSNIRLDIQTSDTAERILEVTLCRMGLSRELIKYFSLFFFQDHDDGVLSVVKKLAEFELPYVSLQSMKELDCKLGIRKWYMDPSLDTLLMDCRASLNLLYMQAIQEVKRNWVKPTEGQMQELEFLQKNANKTKFLELMREVQFYGYVRLDPCICDYPEEGCSADIYVGNNEINCCIKLPTNQIKEGATKGGEDDTLELRFEYNDSGTWQWIILYTKQAFLLSSCLKKMILEQMKAAKEGQEMEIKMPESTKNSKKSSIQQKQVVHSDFISRKSFLVRPNEDNCVFEKIREEDL
ncbi:sorting nexin-31 isoform X2 [Tyto alba]|uniref:sorting nexin-31 isoform X2 n=1 Tax=Tyto alba TaxID=56313 RepID=UPI001C66CD7F|nr:sorting nexin-31 isoform X2 [Tyto alba]